MTELVAFVVLALIVLFVGGIIVAGLTFMLAIAMAPIMLLMALGSLIKEFLQNLSEKP